MTIECVRVPLGVVGVIYESRPNVTADAGALALKAGNAVILRGGSESFRSTRAIHVALARAESAAGLPEGAISLVPTRDRAAVGMLLAGLDNSNRCDRAARRQGPGGARADRGARAGVRAPRRQLPRGIDRAAKPDMAKNVLLNAKMRRTGVCGAAERAVDRAGRRRTRAAGKDAAGRRLRGPRGRSTRKADGAGEARRRGGLVDRVLDAIVAAGVVDGVTAAIAHIERYGSHHTDAIVTADHAGRRRSS